MALTPQQLQALFQSISAGSQGAFAGATPDMSQDERNQWINSYGTGGTNYGDYLRWYAGNNGTSNQVGSVSPAQINTSGSYPAGGGTMPYLTSLTNPTGFSSQTPAGFTPPGGPKGGGAGGINPSTFTRPTNPSPTMYQGNGTQYYSPGSGAGGPSNPYAMTPSTMPGTPQPPVQNTNPVYTGGTPPGGGTMIGRPKSGGGYGLFGGGANGYGLMNGVKWR